MEAIKEEKKPAKKPRGHRRKLYGEQTTVIGTCVPVSEVDSFLEHVQLIKIKWLEARKKTA